MSRPKVVFNVIYHEIARRLLMKQEVSEIAQATLIPEDRLMALMRRPAFKELLEKLTAKKYEGIDQTINSDARNLREELNEAAFASFDRLVQLQRCAASESLVANISQDILDRAGFGKQTKVEETRIFKIDSLDAEILAGALEKERVGREHMQTKNVDELLKSGKDVPIGQHSANEPDKPTP
jgi:hypothetical protein